MEMKLKPFDLEAAKAGAPVVTRDGRPVRILTYDARRPRPIVALVDNGDYDDVETYMENGGSMPSKETAEDLFIAPVKRSGWMNMYREGIKVRGSEAGTLYRTKEEAIASIDYSNEEMPYVATAFAEWEE